MLDLRLLKTRCVRVALAASLVAPVLARCSVGPVCPPAWAYEAPDNGEDDATGELEADPMVSDYDERRTHHRRSSEGTEPMPVLPYAGTIQRTDGMGDDQPLRWYRIQPKDGDAMSVRCLKMTDQMVTCTE